MRESASTSENGVSPRSPSKRHVVDEDGSVDQKVKNQILRARERVAEREDQIFVQAPLEANIDRHKQVAMWGTTVKQYLRLLEPLLRSSDVEEARDYYQTKQVGTIRLVPPDKDGYQFSLLAEAESHDDTTLRRMLELPREVELPEPATVQIRGLRGVIELPQAVSETWHVTVDNTGVPPEHETLTLQAVEPIPKQVYEDAVRLADEFRQKAGIGIEIGHRETDDKDLNPV